MSLSREATASYHRVSDLGMGDFYHPPLSRFFHPSFCEDAGGGDLMVSTPALLSRLWFLRASFLLGIPREFPTMSQVRHRLREGSYRHRSVPLPALFRGRDVPPNVRRRHVAQHLVIRRLLLDHPGP